MNLKHELKILGRSELEKYNIDKDCIIISIKDKGAPIVNLPSNPHIKSILYVSFNDTDLPTNDSISDNQAKLIANFIKEHYDTVPLIICQCEAGISRSAGVAKAISQWAKIPMPQEIVFDPYIKSYILRYLPNELVFKKVLHFLNNDTELI